MGPHLSLRFYTQLTLNGAQAETDVFFSGVINKVSMLLQITIIELTGSQHTLATERKRERES